MFLSVAIVKFACAVIFEAARIDGYLLLNMQYGSFSLGFVEIFIGGMTENLSDSALVFEDSELSKDCMIYRCFIEKLLKVNFMGMDQLTIVIGLQSL